MDFLEIQKLVDQMMRDQNNRSIPDFEGYSPIEMHQILYFPFGAESPLKLQKLSDSDYNRIPILNQVKYLTFLIENAGEMKLTKKGFLPTKVVSDLYHQGFLQDEVIEKGYVKLYKESDSRTVNLTRILLELSGLTKKRNGKLSLTKLSKKKLSDNDELLRLILLTFVTKFNWAYFDAYGENQIGQFGYGFSLILLSKYGGEKRMDTFYAKRYFKALPQLLDKVENNYGTVETYATHCYSIRTFERFLLDFGLIKIEKEVKEKIQMKYITKTDLFDKLIKCTPHKKLDSQ